MMTTTPDPDKPHLETDDRFPSGPWEGYFLEPRLSNRFRMELSLEFADGRMTGDGLDYVGPFVIHGRYDTNDGKCTWVKQYLGQHAVYYEGYNEGRGIWGTWEIRQIGRGGFHIWPEGMSGTSSEKAAESEDLPASIRFEDEVPASLEPSLF